MNAFFRCLCFINTLSPKLSLVNFPILCCLPSSGWLIMWILLMFCWMTSFVIFVSRFCHSVYHQAWPTRILGLWFNHWFQVTINSFPFKPIKFPLKSIDSFLEHISGLLLIFDEIFIYGWKAFIWFCFWSWCRNIFLGMRGRLFFVDCLSWHGYSWWWSKSNWL